MGCQKAIAAKIIAGNGNFVIGVKGNQPTLHDTITYSVSTFAANSSRPPFVSIGRSQITVTGNWTCCSTKTQAEFANALWPTICHGCDGSPSVCSSTIPAKTASKVSNKEPPGIITSSRKSCFLIDQTSRPLCSLPGRKPRCIAVPQDSSCKTFRSGWASQPGRPRVRVRWLITNLPLVPGELARGEINCCLKNFSTDCDLSRTPGLACRLLTPPANLRRSFLLPTAECTRSLPLPNTQLARASVHRGRRSPECRVLHCPRNW